MTRNHDRTRRIGLPVLAALGWLVCMPAAAVAAEYYVTPSGAGLADGSDWANAFSNVQDAVDAVVEVGDVIYLQEGDYLLDSALSISGKPSFALEGGYEGSGSPGTLVSTPSVLQADAVGMRVVNAANWPNHTTKTFWLPACSSPAAGVRISTTCMRFAERQMIWPMSHRIARSRPPHWMTSSGNWTILSPDRLRQIYF